MHFVYILQSEVTGKHYYGSTSDLQARLKAHNNGQNISTKAHRPWKVVWYGAFEDTDSARNFEKYLKSGSGIAFTQKHLL
jgi:predicted GIY-YIG superfamily endonuclease